MNEAAGHPAARPRRTWLPMALWTAAILAALGLAWFVGAVAVPVWQVRAEVAKVVAGMGRGTSSALEQLGTREQAARKIRLYLHTPSFVAKHKYAAVQILAEMREDAVPLLMGELANSDPEVRQTAAMELGNLGATDAAPAIAALLEDRDALVRIMAADTLGHLDAVGGKAVPLLIALLDDTGSEGKFRSLRRNVSGTFLVGGVVSKEVRHHAALALAAGGPRAKAAAPALMKIARTRGADQDMRRCALIALGQIGPAGGPLAPDLLETLDDPDDGGVRAAAAWALGRLPPAPPGLVPRLVKLLADPDANARLCAAESLGLLGKEAAEAVPALVEVLEDAEVRERGEAGKLPPPSPDAEVLVASKRFEPMGVRRKWHEEMHRVAMEALGLVGPAARPAVPGLVRALDLKEDRAPNYDPEDSDRCRIAAEALGRIGPGAEAAVPALVKLMGTSVNDGGVLNSEVAEALGKIGPAAVPTIIRFLREGKGEHGAARALGIVGPPAREAVPELIKVLDDIYMPARVDAAWALGRIGPDAAAAIPRLEAMLKEREDLSAAAAGALKNIRGGEPPK